MQLKTFAVAAALLAGASSGAMAQYVCPPGYSYYGGVCQPTYPPGYSNPVSGGYRERRPALRRATRLAARLARLSAALSEPQPARLAELPACCRHRTRGAPTDTGTTTAPAIGRLRAKS